MLVYRHLSFKLFDKSRVAALNIAVSVYSARYGVMLAELIAALTKSQYSGASIASKKKHSAAKLLNLSAGCGKAEAQFCLI